MKDEQKRQKDEGRRMKMPAGRHASTFLLQPSSFSFRHSLRWRLFLTLMIVAVVAVVFVSLFANRSTTNAFGRYVLGDLERDQWAIAHLLESQLQGSRPEEAQLLVNAIGEAYGRPITVTDAEGQVFVGASPFAEPPPEAFLLPEHSPDSAVLNFRAVPLESTGEVKAPSWRVVPVPLTADEAELIARFNGDRQELDATLAAAWSLTERPFTGSLSIVPESGVPAPEAPEPPYILTQTQITPGYALGQGRVESVESFIGSVNLFFWLAAVGAVAMAGVLSLGLSQRILRPVQRLTEAARRMETGDLDQRVEVAGKDEISQLGHAFNAMADGLQRQEQLRRNMVTDIAHELRTPLSNIRGYLEAVQDGVLAADGGTLHTMHEEVILLSRLVDDLQELSLAEAGQLRLDLRPLKAADIIEPAVQSVRPLAQAKSITLEVELAEDLPLVTADAKRTGQVLRNLLQNALAHTPPNGRVMVVVQCGGAGERGSRGAEEQGGEGGKWQAASGKWAVSSVHSPTPPISQSPIYNLQSLTVAVSDNGPGIAAEHLPFIFDRFYRVDTSRARATGGSGLGLAIAKALVEMQGGRIWAESEVGVGTTFFFTLPGTPSESV